MKGARAVGAVIARLDSTRLPGKVLEPLGDRALIDHVVLRARQARRLDDLVLATTDRPVDDRLADHAARLGLSVHRGPVDDVAGRVLGAAQAAGATWVLRFNGDSPFLDPALVDRAIEAAEDEPEAAIVSNLPGRTFPYGIAVEAVAVAALAAAHPKMGPEEREHVTSYFYADPEVPIVAITSDQPDLAAARLVVDTPDDLERCRRIVAALGADALVADHRAVAAAWRATVGTT